MAFNVQDVILETQNLYHLNLLAGKKGCVNGIGWVHLVEDETILQRLNGKDLVVTTGLGFQNDEKLFSFVQKLQEVHSVGLIVNTGYYIMEIPEKIIKYCEENDFPLLTCPWEVSINELIKDVSYRIIRAEREDKQINQLIMQTLINPRIIEDTRSKLAVDFDMENSFQVVVIRVRSKEELGMLERRHLKATIELCLEKIEGNYAFFWFDGSYVLVINGLEQRIVEELIRETNLRLKKRSPYLLHMGIGSRMIDFTNLIASYKRALAACDMSYCFDKPYVFFDEMGISQLLFSIEDKSILRQIENKYLSKLREYDRKHKAELEETLHNYLLYDCNLKAMSENLYLHRNTINYRLNKIKEITNCQFYSFEDKVPYMIAFYIKEMKL
ncbi:MAG: PucR family transcriptional regulator ligand-binding domain-containing protein [Bacillota bacterium]|nr:PucR family transcriptional regulator ligand-binding domain-containing protein [Bacillota bacterium]